MNCFSIEGRIVSLGGLGSDLTPQLTIDKIKMGKLKAVLKFKRKPKV